MKLQIWLIVLAIITTIGFGLYHPFFCIKDIEINGLQRINQNEFQAAVQSVMNYKKFFIIPGSNYFVLNVDEINEILKEKFPINSIIVKKTFPRSLLIIVEEKISTLIYDNEKEYSYIGLDGNIVEIIRKVGEDEWQHITTTTISINEDGEEIREEKIIESIHKPPVGQIIKEMGDYPIVYDKRGERGEENINTTVLNKTIVAGLIKWFDLIQKRTDIPFGYVIIENELGDGIIKSREGWYIKAKLNTNIDQQFESLEYVLKEKVNRPNFNYIDLRFDSQVYWK